MHKRYLIALLFLLLLIPYYPVSSQSWLSGWTYRMPITISNSGSALSNYQVLVTVDTASLISAEKMSSDCGDIRFTDSDGVTLLNYWIEPETINTASTRIWVKVPSIPASSTKTIYMYYGNPSATSQSNGDNVFDLFDDFDDGVFNTNKWSIKAGTLGTDIVEANGVLEVRYQSTRGEVASVQSFLYNYRRVNRALVTSTSFPHECSQQNFQSPLDAIQWYGADSLLTWNEGSCTRTDLSLTKVNTWNKYEVDWVQGKVVFKFNDVVKATHTSNIPDEALYLDLVAPSASGGKVVYDWVFVAKYVDPEPTVSLGSEQAIPPTISVQNFSFTYSYNGNYQVSADVCYASTVKFYRTENETYDSYTQINSTCNRYYKTYSNLPAGSYTITVYGENTGNSVSKSFTLTISKGMPSLSLSITNGTWIQGGSISTSKNNKGDSDLVYKTFLENTYLGGIGTFTVNNKPSGIYTVIFNVTEGQNWTSSSISKKLEIYKAWEKTDSIYSNRSYRYDYDKSAIPVVSYFRYKNVNTTAYVNQYLYVYSLTNVTNNDTILQQTFTNIIVNVSAPSGFVLLNSSSFSISSLTYGQTYQTKIYAKAIAVYEKARTLNTGHAVYNLTVNSSFVSELPVIYVLPEPPYWSQRISYNITVDGKTSGFTFDPNTLTLNISTSFSQSSLEVGDHSIILDYSLPLPSVSAQNAVYTYQYGGSYNVSALVANAASVKFYLHVNETFDYNETYDATYRKYTKTYHDLPAGVYNITVYAENSVGSVSSTATLTINKASLSGTISAPSVTYPTKLSVTASENNKGDNDVQYQIYCGNLKVSGLSGVFDLPAGSYICILNTTAGPFQNYTASSNIASVSTTISKGMPSLSLSITNGTWLQGGKITAFESNKGDSDVAYRVYFETALLGGTGTYTITNKPSGIYTVILNTTEGQNWTSSSITKKLEIYKAWERTDSIYANQSYRYDYDKSAVPIYAYVGKYRNANTTVYVNKPLYIYAPINITNEDTMLHQTFTNIMVNTEVPSGFTPLPFFVPSLAYGQTYSSRVYAKAVGVYEKEKTLNIGHATYTLTVNSSFVSELPVIYQLTAPPYWSQRVSYNITVDNKSTGFSFDPDTLTLNISTSFSQSSLEVGDHIIVLNYSLSSAPSPPPSPAPTPSPQPSGNQSKQVEVVSPPPSNAIYLPTTSIFRFFGISIPLGYLFIALMILLCLLLIILPRKRKRSASWLRHR